MSSKCVISFDNNPLGVYYAGQMVSGTIELTTTRPKTIRSMHVVVKGCSEVRWTETVQKTNQEGQTQSGEDAFLSEECYISAQTYVYGQSGGGSLNLPPGRYTYPFQVVLPPHCPTSMNGKYGQIHYEVVFTIDRPLRYHNVFKQPFTVISPLDLNLHPTCANAAEKKEQKDFCCGACCGNNNPIIVVANVAQTGYVPGQKINFRVSIDNQSNTDCSEVKAKLCRTTKYTSRAPETKIRGDELKVAEIKLEGVPKTTQREINGSLQIPATTPSTLGTCSIIQVEYSLFLNVRISGLYTNINIPFPLTIGTVPLNINSGGPVTTQPGIQPTYTSISPSYEEDVNKTYIFVSNDEFNKFMKNTKFIPKYPVYKNTALTENPASNINGSQNTPQHPPPPYPGNKLPQASNSLYPPTPEYSNPTNTPYPQSPSVPSPVAHLPTQPNSPNSSNQIGWSM